MLKVFVYGTLKPGGSNYQRYCAGKVVEETSAIAHGKLFALKLGYPAMTTGDGKVHGFLLSFADSAVLLNLDELEDYDQERKAAQNLYNRHEIQTYDLDARSLGTAWVYLMTPEQVRRYGGVALPCGCWKG